MSTQPTNGKSQWALVISILSVGGVMLAGAWQIVDLKIESAVIKQTSKSSTERAAFEAEMRTRLIEIETQFRAEDQARNIQWANMNRTQTILWEKTFGTRYPSDIQFYPQISK